MTRVEMSLENVGRGLDRLTELRYQDWEELKTREKRLDNRIGELVSAIGKLIERLPPPRE
jgi:hypothetical protein